MKVLFRLICLFWAVAASAHAATKLTLGHGSAIDHPRHLAALHFAEKVDKYSEGRVKVEVFPAASMGDDVTLLRALLDGTLDLSANSQGAISKVVPEYAAIGMPFLFSSAEAAWKVLDGAAGTLLAERTWEKGLKVLGYWDNGIRHLSNDVRTIRVPDDVRGLRIRTPPDQTTVDLIEALGGKPKQIKWSDVHDALQRKVVDGQENPLVNILTGKLYQVQKYLSLTGHKYELTPFVIARARWERLSEADRTAISTAAREATLYQRKLSQQENTTSRTELQRKGMIIQEVDKAAFMQAARPIYDKWLASPIGEFLRLVMAESK